MLPLLDEAVDEGSPGGSEGTGETEPRPAFSQCGPYIGDGRSAALVGMQVDPGSAGHRLRQTFVEGGWIDTDRASDKTAVGDEKPTGWDQDNDAVWLPGVVGGKVIASLTAKLYCHLRCSAPQRDRAARIDDDAAAKAVSFGQLPVRQVGHSDRSASDDLCCTWILVPHARLHCVSKNRDDSVLAEYRLHRLAVVGCRLQARPSRSSVKLPRPRCRFSQSVRSGSVRRPEEVSYPAPSTRMIGWRSTSGSPAATMTMRWDGVPLSTPAQPLQAERTGTGERPGYARRRRARGGGWG
ncbi:hypothetical protein GA0070558_15614 [Micromonospora haikouensis]|uniref:Uncharacterized protein n=1 Tax=Micromonospora haikouensis TaxID=686309 RepID=A0A1C4YM95_9ACTN|nr:hypothetical protein GA0070558_15614 [Micromonospora haikouensis]